MLGLSVRWGKDKSLSLVSVSENRHLVVDML